MKKVIVGLLAVILATLSVQPAHAADRNTLVIIDTAVNSDKIPNIIYEACFTYEKTCQNKTNEQTGKGSAAVTNWSLGFNTKLNVDHGNQVAQAAVIANPDVKIIFIRIADERPTNIHWYSESRQKAIEWVVKNVDTFGIKAVSMSQSTKDASSTTLYTQTTCPNDVAFKSSLQSLLAQKVLVFAASGNDGKPGLGFPSCIPGVIAVGALKPSATSKAPYTSASFTGFASYSNYGQGLGAVARGDANVIVYGKPGLNVATGTSIASPMAASIVVGKIGSKTWDDFKASLSKVLNYPYVTN
jgi:hypothetical protein